jgi:hypothetical protein
MKQNMGGGRGFGEQGGNFLCLFAERFSFSSI